MDREFTVRLSRPAAGAQIPRRVQKLRQEVGRRASAVIRRGEVTTLSASAVRPCMSRMRNGQGMHIKLMRFAGDAAVVNPRLLDHCLELELERVGHGVHGQPPAWH